METDVWAWTRFMEFIWLMVLTSQEKMCKKSWIQRTKMALVCWLRKSSSTAQQWERFVFCFIGRRVDWQKWEEKCGNIFGHLHEAFTVSLVCSLCSVIRNENNSQTFTNQIALVIYISKSILWNQMTRVFSVHKIKGNHAYLSNKTCP